ncbi:hypothetical protein [Streptomyces sp. 1331.2]|uniref:hypothetical protein n=1 Tax=Streptomyces sp. 1331.2 TaxID=1938835 RepID=UPI000BD6928D|nr:hypothetical protein [Streptomyces sp. 1331.2]SOB85694.1 hypothetical protein SAMN06272789_5985 [Streptomyces sp. 1331.2]
MRYEFRIAGAMSGLTVREAFPELESVFLPDQTLLFGPVTDEAHLYGLLSRFQALGLHVMELRRLPEPEALRWPGS